MSDEMIVIDGSGGEGGGQILRTSLAFSAVTGIPLRVDNIRANRSKPGLARQHLAGLELLGRICNAEISGGNVGSASVEFSLGRITHGDYSYDIGTAGSITLLLQTVMPALASVPGRSRIEITGGTDVKWAPPLDYYNLVLFPLLEKFGLKCRIETGARGYFPRGGGQVTFTVDSPPGLLPVSLEPLGELTAVRGNVNITGLPLKIAERIRNSAMDALPGNIRAVTEIGVEHRPSGPGQGVGIVLSATDGHTCIGASSLGERGKSAETVGLEAARSLLEEIGYHASVDIHASDQLLPYLAMAGGSYTAGILSGHAETNVATLAQFNRNAILVGAGPPVRFSADPG